MPIHGYYPKDNGCLAQGQSVCSTRRRSEVQILQHPPSMEPKVIYQDSDLLVSEKPPGISVFPEGNEDGKTFIDLLTDSFPELRTVGEAPRYGAVHRLDKETSGVILTAKNDRALKFFQDQFQSGEVAKEYVALCVGIFTDKGGLVDTFMARSPKDRRKQKAYPLYDLRIKGKARKAVTEYEVLKKIGNYTLIKAVPKTGRKHQIRCHMAHLHHPIAGDRLYGFKDHVPLKGLERQFLHAERLTIRMPGGDMMEFHSPLPDNLKEVLDNLQKNDQ